jgi:hypothetical protein
VVGGWLQIHQPEVLPPYFAARKKNPVCSILELVYVVSYNTDRHQFRAN